jgi:hypothetical protein
MTEKNCPPLTAPQFVPLKAAMAPCNFIVEHLIAPKSFASTLTPCFFNFSSASFPFASPRALPSGVTGVDDTVSVSPWVAETVREHIEITSAWSWFASLA